MEKRIRIAAISVVFLSWLAVLSVGLVSRTPMVGDEVTHYYMLVTQSERLPTPTCEAIIPAAGPNGEDSEGRNYPHTFAWHYAGAILYRLTGLQAVIQIYHSLFMLQLLLVVFALTKKLGGVDGNTSLLALFAVASMPTVLLFSVAFYQDVPAIAQAVTAFYLLIRKRWLSAAVFMALALAIKENMFLFLPAYVLLMFFIVWKMEPKRRIIPTAGTLLIFFLTCAIFAWSLKHYVNCDYYPLEMLKVTVNRVLIHLPTFSHGKCAGNSGASATSTASPLSVAIFDDYIKSVHPGDLRIPQNWIIYGGGVLYLLVLAAIMGFFAGRMAKEKNISSDHEHCARWLWLAGISYIVLAYYFLEAPDARFFMPGLIFIVIPMAVQVVKLPKIQWWIWAFAVLAVLQSGVVLYKTYSLRHVSAGIMEAVDYLRREPPKPNRIFMYPEGNYRLFPCPHEWYLLPKYDICDLWKGNNDQRLALLSKHGIGAVVVKKHLVGTIDPEMKNLRVYPDFFVRDIDSDGRFRKVLDNKDVTIYRLPDSSP